MNFQSAVPLLRIFDYAKAKEFYIDFLGFNLDWEHNYDKNFPMYCQLSKGQCHIHLSEHFGDCSPGAAIRIEMDDISAYQQQLLNKNYAYAKPEIVQQPWNTIEMPINDPFYNRLIFFQQL